MFRLKKDFEILVLLKWILKNKSSSNISYWCLRNYKVTYACDAKKNYLGIFLIDRVDEGCNKVFWTFATVVLKI